jgi:ribosomal protein S1
MPFLRFVTDHPVGSEVEATVDRFSSHGAYAVTGGGAQCYIPLKAMADPPPTKAREVLTVGEVRTLVVTAFDPPRRGIDVALPGVVVPDASAEPAAPVRHNDGLPAGEHPSAEEAPSMAVTKKAAKKATSAKKAVVKKAATVQKAAAKKASPAKQSTAKQSTAKKASTAKKTTGKKASVAKKATAKKASTAKKATADKATSAKKATAQKASTAKKATANKATTAKKAPAQKASTAKKASARTPAKKAPASKKTTR